MIEGGGYFLPRWGSQWEDLGRSAKTVGQFGSPVRWWASSQKLLRRAAIRFTSCPTLISDLNRPPVLICYQLWLWPFCDSSVTCRCAASLLGHLGSPGVGRGGLHTLDPAMLRAGRVCVTAWPRAGEETAGPRLADGGYVTDCGCRPTRFGNRLTAAGAGWAVGRTRSSISR